MALSFPREKQKWYKSLQQLVFACFYKSFLYIHINTHISWTHETSNILFFLSFWGLELRDRGKFLLSYVPGERKPQYITDLGTPEGGSRKKPPTPQMSLEGKWETKCLLAATSLRPGCKEHQQNFLLRTEICEKPCPKTVLLFSASTQDGSPSSEYNSHRWIKPPIFKGLQHITTVPS